MSKLIIMGNEQSWVRSQSTQKVRPINKGHALHPLSMHMIWLTTALAFSVAASGAGAQSLAISCQAQLTELAQNRPDLAISPQLLSAAARSTDPLTLLFPNRRAAELLTTPGSNVVRFLSSIPGDSESAAATGVSLSAYAAIRGIYSLSELVAIGRVDTLLSEGVGGDYPLTFSGTNNDSSVIDAAGYRVQVQDSGVIVCNQRILVVDALVLPVREGRDLPLLSLQTFANLVSPFSEAPAVAPVSQIAPAPAPALASFGASVAGAPGFSRGLPMF